MFLHKTTTWNWPPKPNLSRRNDICIAKISFGHSRVRTDNTFIIDQLCSCVYLPLSLSISFSFSLSVFRYRGTISRVESSSLGFHFHAQFDSAILLFRAITFFIFLEPVITRAAPSGGEKQFRRCCIPTRASRAVSTVATITTTTPLSSPPPTPPSPRAHPRTVPKRTIKNNHLNRTVRMKGQI